VRRRISDSLQDIAADQRDILKLDKAIDNFQHRALLDARFREFPCQGVSDVDGSRSFLCVAVQAEHYAIVANPPAKGFILFEGVIAQARHAIAFVRIRLRIAIAANSVPPARFYECAPIIFAALALRIGRNPVPTIFHFSGSFLPSRAHAASLSIS
jgi:hypothetical protein